ncbi:Bug family tripartite tricarboxylate transporter substrate binding protein [Ramlibacter sp.]|uniref:Bug family tripartite tricarboxylate transporter substrate binding protein n=1 Tax=Ramlibacter sp. TaxID=1917967 RepID=UPI003D149CB7
MKTATPTLTRRRLMLAAASVSATTLPTLGFAQEYPSKPIKFVVPVSAGTGTDLIVRFLANGLQTLWRTTTVVDNRVGASGVIGTDVVAKSAPDGYTLLATYAVHYSNPWAMDKVPYEAVKDFVPVGAFANSALSLIVPTDSPFKSVQDLIDAAKKNPGMYTYGTAGVGSTGHVCASLFTSLTGVNLRHVPYKSAAQPVVDTAGGQVHMSFAGTSSSIGLVKAGKLRVLATTGRKRSAILPDTPTMQEAGVKGYEVSSPVWIMAPAGTPDAIVNKLSAAMLTYARLPEFKDLCTAQGLDVDLEDAATARKKAPAEFQKWKNLVALTGANKG